MDSKQYGTHFKEAKRINKRIFFQGVHFEYDAVISDALILLSDLGEEYDPKTFYLIMYKVMSKANNQYVKTNPRLQQLKRESNQSFKQRNRKKAGDWYIRHLLSKKHSKAEIDNNPNLIEQKRQEILNIRKGNIKKQLPEFPAELMDLSIIDESYIGYGLTVNCELYSCKALYKTDVAFTTLWRPLAKRKSGMIRLNINGIKRDLGIKSILQTLYKK